MGSQHELLELASLLYLENLEQCIRYRANIDNIFRTDDDATKELCEFSRAVLSNIENICATHASGILFSVLVSLSHFTQKSMYIHWKEVSGLKNINLFGLIVGLSAAGSDKSGLINVIQSCYKTCERLFPETYMLDGKKSIMHDITGAGLHKELSNGSKFLIMHEADSNLTKLGFYHQGQAGSASARSLLCEAFDGFTESSKTTGMYDFLIKASRLSLLGATTGSSLHLLLAHYTTHKISDGCDNRFLYHFTENDLIPYDLVRKPDPFLPSIQQIFVIVHLIGRIVYKFTDSTGNDEAQRYYATKGRYYIEEGGRLFRERQQSHLQSFYSKSAEIFPRICVNMQRFLDAMMVLLKMRQGGDLQFSQAVNEKFVINAKQYIELNLNSIKNSMGDFVSYVNLETCQIAGNLYDNYLFKTTMALFTLDTSPLQPSPI
ncbi:unnamed protein product [Rotaria magnacalcarata]|uniref:Uncharacterized protein n=2 Tax=Rotaria magnacalcarata TaxID=392030 RepID=A0A815A761_9BILA|nr:unnamed protein product [Rotaria magnacalcarata]